MKADDYIRAAESADRVVYGLGYSSGEGLSRKAQDIDDILERLAGEHVGSNADVLVAKKAVRFTHVLGRLRDAVVDGL